MGGFCCVPTSSFTYSLSSATFQHCPPKTQQRHAVYRPILSRTALTGPGGAEQGVDVRRGREKRDLETHLFFMVMYMPKPSVGGRCARVSIELGGREKVDERRMCQRSSAKGRRDRKRSVSCPSFDSCRITGRRSGRRNWCRWGRFRRSRACNLCLHP